MILDMLKNDTQRNSVCPQGATTVGKSYWFTEPFKLVNSDYIGFTTNHEVFGFEGCTDKEING